MDAKELKPMQGLAAWLRNEAARHDESICRGDKAVQEHVETLRAWAKEIDAALHSDAEQAPIRWLSTRADQWGACRFEKSDSFTIPVYADPIVPVERAPEKNRDAEISQLIDERDSFEHMGTVLAEKVSELLNVDVGEWSSANNPIFRAIHAIEDRIAATSVAPGAAAQGEVVRVGSETWNVLRLCVNELSGWMRDHGQDLRSQEAVKRARSLLKPAALAATAPSTGEQEVGS